MPVIRPSAAVVVLSALGAASAPALANMARPQAHPAGFATATAGNERTEVEREDLTFDCREDPAAARSGVPVCRFRAAYFVHNPGADDEHVRGAFVGEKTEGVTVTLGGKPATSPLGPGDVASIRKSLEAATKSRLDELARRTRSGDDGTASEAERRRAWLEAARLEDALAHVDASSIVPFEARFAGGGRSELVATGTMRPGAYFVPGSYLLDPIRVRHLVLGEDRRERRQHAYDFLYPIYPIQTWANAGPVAIRVRYPEGWTLEGGLERVDGTRAPFRITGPGEATLTVDGKEGHGLWLRLRPPPPAPIYPGGPMLGLGRKLGDGFRLRAGYELAAPHWLVHSLTVDTDFDSRLVVTPAVEAATPGVLIGLLPSFSTGIGLPVRILPEPQVGFRTSAGVSSVLGVGFQATVDWYPATPTTDRDRVDVLMMGRLSL